MLMKINQILNHDILICPAISSFRQMINPAEKTISRFLSRIDPYINLYGKNTQIDGILDSTLNELENLKVRPNPEIHPTIPQQRH